MFRIICVTNRKLCAADFISRLSEISRGGADYVILREKDLSEADYAELAERALAVCGGKLVIHGTGAMPLLRRLPRIHLPLAVLENNPNLRREAELLGVSVHSPEEAKRAEALGADYATAGHVFATDCKRGVPGRGLDFLKATAASVRIPVYAIGGISAQNVAAVRGAEAAGACVMSGLMSCPNARAELEALRRALA